MRTYENITQLWGETLSHLLRFGLPLDSRNGGSLETMGYVARLQNPQANFLLNPVRKLSIPYAAAEFLWYLSGDNNIDMIKYYAPQYEKFAEEGIAWGAYGYRWAHDSDIINTGLMYGQLTLLLKLLEEKPNTRQAILSMWKPYDLLYANEGTKKDIPCTLSLNFLVRNNALYLTTTMRSNDAWLGLPYDVWCFTLLQQMIAGILNLKLGWYQHQVMSMHLYDKNKDIAKQAIRNKEWKKNYPQDHSIYFSGEVTLNDFRNRKYYLDMEEQMRIENNPSNTYEVKTGFFKDLLIMCGLKNDRFLPIFSPILNAYNKELRCL